MLQSKRMLIAVRLIVMLAIFMTLIVGCGKDKEKTPAVDTNTPNLGMQDGEIVATYKGGEVTAKEFQQYLDFLALNEYPENDMITDKTQWNDYLKLYIGQQVVIERAKEKNLVEKADALDQVYTSIKDMVTQSLEKGTTYDQLLLSLNLNEQEVKEQIRRMLLVSEYFYSLKSDTELKRVYDENLEYFMTASVRHILISNEERTDEEAKALATELAKRIRAGEDFAALAKEYTDDGNGEQGGLYENQPVYKWVEEFKKATMTLPLNTVSDPVQTEYGYHVMRVESRDTMPFEQVKGQIAATEAQTAYNQYLSTELDALNIDSKLPKE